MKKICIFLFLLLIPVSVFAESDLTPTARSSIMIEASSGEILYSKNAYEKLAPASMTKMMSLIIIMENIESGKLNWNDTIVISKNAASMGGSQIYLEENEKMSVEDLIKGICIASGNDATVALAEKIAGTESNFVKMMNKKVKELGLKNTNFINSTGLDAENHYSTAYDMSLIAKELVKHEKILEFSSIYEDYLRNNSFWLVNTNKLVKFYSYIDGLKTGYTSDAGYCLTATGKKQGMRLITVVMGEDSTNNRTKDTISLMNYGYNIFSISKLVKKDEVLGDIEVSLGSKEKVSIVSSKEINILNDTRENYRDVTYNLIKYSITAPVKKGDVVGKLDIYEKGVYKYSVDVTIDNDVEKINIFKLIIKNIKNIIEL